MTRAAPADGQRAARIVILAAVSAALHVGKLPAALPVLREALGISLLQAGFLLSLVQLAGMTLGLGVGLLADTFGLRRGMLLGLVVLGAASLAGGWARTPSMLLVLRAIEGVGFLLTVTPGPSLIRRLVGAEADRAMGLWGAYMPLGTALALLLTPVAIAAIGWTGWWWLLGGATLAMAALLRAAVPADASTGALPPTAAAPAAPIVPASPPASLAARGGAASGRGGRRVDLGRLGALARLTLTSAGPWSLALTFGAYAGQWFAVLGFLPSIYAQAGVSPLQGGVLTALVAAVNMVGNIAAGRLLQRGVPAPRLLRTAFVTMAVGAAAAYLPWFADVPALRFAALLLFSMVGGLVPGTLFALSMRLAPDARAVSTTVGWMQQCSAFGQFVAPPIVAWVAHRVGGWEWTWVVTGAMAAAGLLLSVWIARLLATRAARATPGAQP